MTVRCLPLASNGVAAWRSGGFQCHSSGAQMFIFALPFLRASCRRCAKPLVICWHSVESVVRYTTLSVYNSLSVRHSILLFCRLVLHTPFSVHFSIPQHYQIALCCRYGTQFYYFVGSIRFLGCLTFPQNSRTKFRSVNYLQHFQTVLVSGISLFARYCIQFVSVDF
jgi:hypothetical protein